MSIVKTITVLPPALALSEFDQEDLITFCRVAAPTVFKRIVQGELSYRFSNALLSAPTSVLCRPVLPLQTGLIRLMRYKKKDKE